LSDILSGLSQKKQKAEDENNRRWRFSWDIGGKDQTNENASFVAGMRGIKLYEQMSSAIYEAVTQNGN
jgi:hypothetical protein